MGTEIRDLSLISKLNGPENIPLYDTTSGRTRAVTADTVKEFVNPVVGMSFNNSTRSLTLTMADGTQISVTIPTS